MLAAFSMDLDSEANVATIGGDQVYYEGEIIFEDQIARDLYNTREI